MDLWAGIDCLQGVGEGGVGGGGGETERTASIMATVS